MKNSKISSVLVAIDLSDYSEIVVTEAKQLAEKLKLPVSYIFVYEDERVVKNSFTTNKRKLQKLYERAIRSRYGIHETDAVFIRFGKPDREIVAAAKKLDGPMIIVGHKSGHAIERFFLGSVAEKLASLSPFPVWIHRGEKTVVPYSIMVPTDLSEQSDKPLDVAKAIRNKLKSKIEVFHVLKQPIPILDYQVWSTVEEALKKDDNKKIRNFKKRYPKIKLIRSRGDVADLIQIHGKKYDLIVIPRRSNSKVSFGQVTGKIIRSGNTPVLIV